MTTTVQIDRKKNPEISDLVADLEPGDKVTLHCSIQYMDDQTLTLTVEEAEEGDKEEKAGGEDATEEESEGESPTAIPGVEGDTNTIQNPTVKTQVFSS